MVKLTIDNQNVEVAVGTTVLQAAAALGIEIPSMCFREGHSCHPSCMVCMVKDADRGNFFPSCAMPVSNGMNITATSQEVADLRREALELLLSDHVGDCEAPCTLTCPAGMDIPLMNRLIAAGKIQEALQVVHAEIALPLILGYICPAPCEKACRRKSIDGAVSICLLKRFTACDENMSEKSPKQVTGKTGKKVAVIGSGPAGLSAAFYLLTAGHDCTLFDKNMLAGGALRYEISDEKLPREMLDSEIETIRMMGAEFRLNTCIDSAMFENTILPEYDAVILATGNRSKQPVEVFGLEPNNLTNASDKKSLKTNRPGVFICGNVIREQDMAVRAAAQGKMAAAEASAFLGSPAPRQPIGFNSAFGQLTAAEHAEYLKESVAGKAIVPEGGFTAGFNLSQAVAEAKRCMHCDCRKPESCKLRIYSAQYSANRRHHLGEQRNLLTKSVHHEMIVYEPEKCIRCGLCVEISSREESLGLSYVGRGFDVRISVPFNESIAEALQKTASSCVDACPTGAMAFKNHEERLK